MGATPVAPLGARSATTFSGPQDYLNVLNKHFSPAVPRSPKGNDIVADYAKGSWVYSMDGRKYLDMQTGIGVANTGHCHPRCAHGKMSPNNLAPGFSY
jgi:4-aminobutyrate aminotransferase-like enzyme